MGIERYDLQINGPAALQAMAMGAHDERREALGLRMTGRRVHEDRRQEDRLLAEVAIPASQSTTWAP